MVRIPQDNPITIPSIFLNGLFQKTLHRFPKKFFSDVSRNFSKHSFRKQPIDLFWNSFFICSRDWEKILHWFQSLLKVLNEFLLKLRQKLYQKLLICVEFRVYLLNSFINFSTDFLEFFSEVYKEFLVQNVHGFLKKSFPKFLNIVLGIHQGFPEENFQFLQILFSTINHEIPSGSSLRILPGFIQNFPEILWENPAGLSPSIIFCNSFSDIRRYSIRNFSRNIF